MQSPDKMGEPVLSCLVLFCCKRVSRHQEQGKRTPRKGIWENRREILGIANAITNGLQRNCGSWSSSNRWSIAPTPVIRLWQERSPKKTTSFHIKVFSIFPDLFDTSPELINRHCPLFIGPRCPWGPIYGSGSLKLTDWDTFLKLNWCDSGW